MELFVALEHLFKLIDQRGVVRGLKTRIIEKLRLVFFIFEDFLNTKVLFGVEKSVPFLRKRLLN